MSYQEFGETSKSSLRNLRVPGTHFEKRCSSETVLHMIVKNWTVNFTFEGSEKKHVKSKLSNFLILMLFGS